MTNDPLRTAKWAGLIALVVIAAVIPVYAVRRLGELEEGTRREESTAAFVGREVCATCHQAETEAFTGSHHDRAMEVADETTVRGDFRDVTFDDGHIRARFLREDGKYLIRTPGPDGVETDFEVAFTFGWEPLQQYMIRMERGRVQCFTVAWNTETREWFNLYPDRTIPPSDWLHWTRNGQNWNGMCAECHSTNLVKGYDFESRSFATTWSEIDVSCEACHGPGSKHVEWAEVPAMARPEVGNFALTAKTGGTTAAEQVESCAPCHSRRTEFGDYDHAGGALMDHLLPAVLRDGLYHPDGQILEEVYVYGSFVQSKMFRQGVRCTDCHDAHRLGRHAEGNDLCTRCHRADEYDTVRHHFHEPVVDGKANEGALCVKCHMPEQPYMVVDWRADHSLRVPDPRLTAELGVPNACSQCHADESTEWAVEKFEAWYGTERKPHYGAILAAGREGRPEAGVGLAALAGDALFPAVVRATALTLLSVYGGPVRDEAFIRALTSEDPLLRYTAVLHVRVASPEELVGRVAPLLDDPVGIVRMQAASRLTGVPAELLKPYQTASLAEARAEYVAAMKRSLDFGFTGFNLGNLYSGSGDAARAEKYYRAAIEVDDLLYPAKVNLATLLNAQGRNDEAEKLLREVLTAQPDQHEVQYSLGLLLAEKGDYRASAIFLGKALAAFPHRARGHYNLSLVLARLGESRTSEAALRRALEIEPDNLDFLHARADQLLRGGDFKTALRVAERMIEEHPDASIGREMKQTIEQLLERLKRR